MKISTKSRYGLRAMFDLAFHGGSRPAQIKDIARRQELSAGYLEQIFQQLKKAGLLNTRRGPRGGYSLARAAEEITIREVLVATGTELSLVPCTMPEKRNAASCTFDARCVTQTVWTGANQHLATYFASVTLGDLCDQAREMGLEREFDHRFVYFI